MQWHFDAKEGRAYGYGISFVTMHLQCGNRSIPINWRIYLREKTVRKLNRLYKQKISFKSKMVLAILCTDTTLSAKKALSFYMRRWAIEVDYLYLKTRLGLRDFRLRSMEGVSKYFTLTFLTLPYLSWRKAEEGYQSISDVIAAHRQEQ